MNTPHEEQAAQPVLAEASSPANGAAAHGSDPGTGESEPDTETIEDLDTEEPDPVSEAADEPSREYDELELSARAWWRFAGIGPSETLELQAIGPGGIQVAYSRGLSSYLKLAQQGDALRGIEGCYQVANLMTGRVRALCQIGSWSKRATRAQDAWIHERRVLPIDIDPVRPAGVSATEDERRTCVEVADHIGRYLSKHVDPLSLGRGGSGNGCWVFVALQGARRDPLEDERIKAFLRALNKKFGRDGKVKIDSTVGNAARIVPLWGTTKRKGQSTPEREHRQTTFSCHGTVVRAPLAALIG